MPSDLRVDAARRGLHITLLAAACTAAGILVATRGPQVGTDTRGYVEFFLTFERNASATRFEPGFVLITRVARTLGVGVAGYQALLFSTLLVTVYVAARGYSGLLGASRRTFLSFGTAVLMMLFVSPMFVNASINVVRQGLASLLVFSALIAFERRRWSAYVLCAAGASSFHYSSVMYLACAPVLLLGRRGQAIIAGSAFVLYCSGVTLAATKSFTPGVYAAVMDFQSYATYRSGTRIDFAVFTMFWYVLAHLGVFFVQQDYQEQVKRAAAVYLVMTLPFFALGWGNFSDRYLLPAWLSASLIVASMIAYGRSALARKPGVLIAGVSVATCVYCYLVLRAGTP